MLNKRATLIRQIIVRIGNIGALLALMLTLGVFSSGTAHAAARTSSLHPTTKPSAVQPYCVGNVTATPPDQTVGVEQYAALHIQWHCEGFVNVGVNVAWHDAGNNTSYYQCLSFCTDGDTDIGHAYPNTGDFYPRVWMSGNASGSYQGSVIHVH